MAQSNNSISPLRQLQEKTQTGYLRSVKCFTKFLGRSPDTASAEDLRAFQKHLVEHGASGLTINATTLIDTGF